MNRAPSWQAMNLAAAMLLLAACGGSGERDASLQDDFTGAAGSPCSGNCAKHVPRQQ